MDTSKNNIEEMSTVTEFHDPKYYSDQARCFVPSCLKYRRDYPKLTFLAIPRSLKETWCQAVDRNCPNRVLHVCQEHINVECDCYRSISGKLHLKHTANLTLVTHYESENEMGIETDIRSDDTAYEKRDFAAQSQYINTRAKAVLAKPCVRSVGCAANIKATSIAEKMMPSLPQQLVPCMLSSSTATSSISTVSLYEPSNSATSSSSSIKEITRSEKDLSGRDHILRLIEENPKMYIGVPKQYFWLVNFLSKQYGVRSLHIIITLFKIKQNDKLIRISNHFDLSKASVLKILKVCLPCLATYFQNLFFLPEQYYIKKTLPSVFKSRFASVQCIIHCFEIEIEKPSDPLIQAQTWSQYKSCNTIKYLLACCPNGLICFISKGYGGRISDKAITQRSEFVDILPPGAVVLADRGFKGLESILNERQTKLLRPPSVSSKETPTKKDVIQSKIIASLRVHVERVIRRVREFSLLKPHSVINHSHIKYLDECVLIACGLINLQGDLPN